MQQILQTEPGTGNLLMDTSPDGSDVYFCRTEGDPDFDCELWVIGVDGHGDGARRVTPADVPADVVGNAEDGCPPTAASSCSLTAEW